MQNIEQECRNFDFAKCDDINECVGAFNACVVWWSDRKILPIETSYMRKQILCPNIYFLKKTLGPYDKLHVPVTALHLI